MAAPMSKANQFPHGFFFRYRQGLSRLRITIIRALLKHTLVRMNARTFRSAPPAILFRFCIHRRAPRSSPLRVRASRLSHHGSLSFLRRPRGRPPSQDQRRRQKPIFTDQNLDLSLDFNDISYRALNTLKQFFRSSETKIHRFFVSGADAYNDLKTSFRVDQGTRITFSCRRSSLQFFGNLFLWSFVFVLALRVLSWLWSFRHRWLFVSWAVTRRDRSLGGREVLVGRRQRIPDFDRRGFKGLVNPLSSVERNEVKPDASLMKKQTIKREKLPKWWPESIASLITLSGNDEGRRKADKLVKAIMDYRVSGLDYKDDDILQLREICRSSGVNVAFETTNARDSFFRAAISFVLNVCTRVKKPKTDVQINGEEAKQFICGFAENIGLDNLCAARLVCAAVAARTRSCFLQAWAFEVQGKRTEALEELSNLGQIYHIFPPEENSPELEMVASGLSNILRTDQRAHLLTLFCSVSSSNSLRIAADALGLSGDASV